MKSTCSSAGKKVGVLAPLSDAAFEELDSKFRIAAEDAGSPKGALVSRV